MTKSNPLFVDSTKFHGDMISTNIELQNVLLYDQETLFVLVTNHRDLSRRIQMKPMNDRAYEALIHLNHQTPITYRFVIEKDGARMFQSVNYKSRAQYAILEVWEPNFEPVTEDVSPEPAVQAPAKPNPPPKPAASWARESSMSVRALIEKWGL